jgi:netrin-G3 ligand
LTVLHSVSHRQGYKVFYTMNPGIPIASWDSQVVDHNPLTTISDLTPHTIYTIRVQAETSVGGGPLSTPVQVKTQQGVPSQPTGLRAIDVSATSVSLEWARPHHTGESVNSYELYWNDTFTKVRRPLSLSLSLFIFHSSFHDFFFFLRLGETSSASARQ